MKKFIIWLVLLAIGCGAPISGKITSKFYLPERNGVETVLIPIMVDDMAYYMPVEQPYHKPEEFNIVVAGKTVRVSQAFYEKCAVGDMYNVEKND
jgi:hypothetical protein